MADFSPGIRSNFHGACTVGALRGISLGGPTSWLGDGSWGRHLQTGVVRSDAEGTPGAPAIALKWVGFWRFKWVVETGARSLTIFAKQAINQSPRPSVILKANAAIGLAADSEVVAGAGTGWVQIDAPFVATADGVLWVEVHNNLTAGNYPVFFDHLSTS